MCTSTHGQVHSGGTFHTDSCQVRIHLIWTYSRGAPEIFGQKNFKSPHNSLFSEGLHPPRVCELERVGWRQSGSRVTTGRASLALAVATPGSFGRLALRLGWAWALCSVYSTKSCSTPWRRLATKAVSFPDKRLVGSGGGERYRGKHLWKVHLLLRFLEDCPSTPVSASLGFAAGATVAGSALQGKKLMTAFFLPVLLLLLCGVLPYHHRLFKG